MKLDEIGTGITPVLDHLKIVDYSVTRFIIKFRIPCRALCAVALV